MVVLFEECKCKVISEQLGPYGSASLHFLTFQLATNFYWKTVDTLAAWESCTELVYALAVAGSHCT